ncbi:MAG: hypothetical protein JRD68_00240 [Deltaproteobacteria bacterium]|nr:hypothetical protein [Deltaproteobacteria bacterium]
MKEYTKTIKFDVGMTDGRALWLVREALERWRLEIGFTFKDWKLELRDSLIFKGQRVLKYVAIHSREWRTQG